MRTTVVTALGAVAGVAGVLAARRRRTTAAHTQLWENAVGPLDRADEWDPPSTVQVNTRRS